MTDRGEQRRIGLFGGTFDPIHIGHLVAAEQVRDQLNLAQVWFLPAPDPPHKNGQTVTAANHRMQMVKRATANHPHFYVSRVEFERSGSSYTVDTMAALRKRHPQYAFYFIIGMDMVQDLPNWHRIEQLVQETEFIGLARPGYDKPSLAEPIARRVQYAEMPLLEISATAIRERVKEGRSIRYLVPESVRNYIEEHHLYET